MTNECEAVGCDNPAAYAVTFTDPSEEVEYCPPCKREKTRQLDYEDVEPL